MDIHIKVLDVGDGDSITVHFSDNNRQLVILIEGGHANKAEDMVKELEPYRTV